MSWAKGDLVEVYDPDETRYQGLPLKIAMPANRAAWIRGRVETA